MNDRDGKPDNGVLWWLLGMVAFSIVTWVGLLYVARRMFEAWGIGG